MNPSIVNSLDDNNNTRSFTLQGANISLANAIRRTIMTEIPIVCVRTETEVMNQCHIVVNTGRLHNEILKHRLSMIPTHETDLERLPGKWELIVDVTNDTEEIIYVTTRDFRLRRKDDVTQNAETDKAEVKDKKK